MRVYVCVRTTEKNSVNVYMYCKCIYVYCISYDIITKCRDRMFVIIDNHAICLFMDINLVQEQILDRYNKIIQQMNVMNSEILNHDQLYYELSNPIISDQEYDMLRADFNKLNEERVRLLEELSTVYNIQPPEKTFEALTSIGNKVQNNKFKKVSHIRPMLSLDNAFDRNDLEEFVKRMYKFLNMDDADISNNNIEFCIEHKIDGLSLSIIYMDGVLRRELTRGNGYIGEDVTHNILVVDAIPTCIPIAGNVEIRGEIYMKIQDFLSLNEQSYKEFSSPRNAAAGSLR